MRHLRPRRAAVLVTAALTFGLPASSQAFEPFRIQGFEVRGLERLEPGRVYRYVELAPGDLIGQAQAQDLLHDLYASGLFSDVSLLRENGTLIIQVAERPTIAEFEISGNEEIPTEDLLDGLRQAGLAEGRVFDRSLLDQVAQELQRQYFAGGRYSVAIDTSVTELDDNRVDIAINIDEGEVTKIADINIVGNTVFSDDELREVMTLRPSSWRTLIGSRDRYSQPALAGDIEAITSYYQNRGYLNFNIDSTQVTLSPDREKIYVTINVEEGERYAVDEVDIAGELIVPEAEVRALISVDPGSTFSREQAQETANRISERLGDEGYAFAEVTPVPEVDEEFKTVDLTFVVEPGRRYYVRRMNIGGNYRTKDEVFRRELRQFEGGYFSSSAVARSRTRLARLPYVEDVQVETVPVPGTDDMVDVNYEIVERSSGSFQVGVGYSSGQGALFNTAVTQTNFLGTGNRVSVEFIRSEFAQSYSAALTEPYWTNTGISRTISAFYRETDSLTNVSSRFNSDSYGLAYGLGLPLSEFDRVRFGTTYRFTELRTSEDRTPDQILQFVEDNGDEFDTVGLESGWIRDTRDRLLFASRGYLSRIGAEVAVPLADLEFYKLNYQYLQYVPIFGSLIGSVGLDVGYGEALGGTSDLPPYEKYFGGGINSVRGYQTASLGPEDEFGNPIGGNFEFTLQSELLLPTPFIDARNQRVVLFVDAGNIFEEPGDFDAGELRAATGIGYEWFTPILGLLKFAIAYPLNDEDDDDTELFAFTFGTSF